MYRVIIALLLVTLAASRGRAQDYVTVTASEDTWILGLNSATVAGGDSKLGICPDVYYWAYLKFNLSNVPATAAPLRGVELRMKRFGGSHPERLAVYLITQDNWNEMFVTGPTRPAPQLPPNSAKLAFGIGREGHDAWSSEALTAAVVQELNGDHTLSILVRQDPEEAGTIRFYESLNTVNGTPPRLIFNYDEEESAGDFDADGCTGVSDFLFMLDYWHELFFGEPIDLNEFLGVLDHWLQGSGCDS